MVQKNKKKSKKIDNKDYCLYCGKKLLPIEDDWVNRRLHLSCHRSVQKILRDKEIAKFRRKLYKSVSVQTDE